MRAFLIPQGGGKVPRKPKRPCSYPGCPKLTDGQYCKEHEAAARRQYNRYGRPADSNKKYGESLETNPRPLCCGASFVRDVSEGRTADSCG